MTTTTVNPNGSTGTAGLTATGGTITAVLADASDATFVDFAAFPATVDLLTLDMSTFTLPAGAVITSVRNNYRGADFGGGLSTVIVWTPTGLSPPPQQLPSTATNFTNFASDISGAVPSTQAHIDAYQLRFQQGNLGPIRIYKASVDFTYATVPTATATGPTGSITTTLSPTTTWTHTAGSDAVSGQTKYQVKVFTSAVYLGGGFSPDTSAAAYDTGQLAGNATSVVVGPLANTTTYRAYVRTAQTTVGVDQFSAWSFIGFSTAATTSDISTVVATADNANGRIQVVVTRNTGTPLWAVLEVQASYDAGTTWQYVRGYTAFVPSGTSATLFDYEVPNGTAAIYRARATYTSGGVIVGAYVTSSAATWTSSSVWIKDVYTPANSITVTPTLMPEPTYDRVVGVFRPIGGTYPVTVSDVRQAGRSTIQLQTLTPAAEAALRKVCNAAQLLVQVPPTSGWGWGSRYCAAGTLSEMRLAQVVTLSHRRWNLALVEVARPPDLT